MIELLNKDCMEVMAGYPDQYFDLALVDPPYGILKPGVNGGGQMKNASINRMDTSWDIAPGPGYFTELFRVSRHQIIFGGNYFPLPPTRGIICWDKKQGWDSFSAWEMAWTSFQVPARIYRYANTGGDNLEPKIHPTQKPVPLYRHILADFAHPGQKVLDTHLGSGSSAIAADRFGVEFTGCEVNFKFFEAASARLKASRLQQRLF